MRHPHFCEIHSKRRSVPPGEFVLDTSASDDTRLMFFSVIQMAEDRASAAAMVEMKTEKLLVLCVNII